MIKTILNARFRSNPAYELILFDRLPDDVREELGDLQNDAEFYGILSAPNESGLTAKTVDQATALLFFTLQQPGPIPGYVRTQLGAHSNQRIAELVLDGVLEIDPSDGVFRSGAGALSLIREVEPGSLGQGKIAQISWAALLYAQALLSENSAMISSRLYHYNTIPAAPEWRQKLPDAAGMPAFLRIRAGEQNHAALNANWRMSSDGLDGGWLAWQARAAIRGPGGLASNASFKLYVSPLPEALPKVFGDILSALAAAQVQSFKVGSGVYGLLRPDKLVAYCSTYEQLAELAHQLQSALAGCPAQGVPFTGIIDEAGLLSWGTDPPGERLSTAGMDRESWRLWVTNQLAVALIAARAAATDESPARFAVERLSLEGVDTRTWTPMQTIWHD